MWPSDVASVGCALFTPHHIQSEMDGIHPSIPSRLVSWLIDGRKCGARSFRFLVFAHVVIVIVVVVVVVVVDDDDVVAAAVEDMRGLNYEGHFDSGLIQTD